MDSSIQQISRKPIPWIEIYPVDIAFLLLNNWRLFLSHIEVAREIGSVCCRIVLWDCFWERYLFCYLAITYWRSKLGQNSSPKQSHSAIRRNNDRVSTLTCKWPTIIGILRSAATSSKLPASLKGSFAI